MFPRLVALTSVSWQTALIAGPVMAGFLYVGSPVWPFVAAARARGGRHRGCRLRAPATGDGSWARALVGSRRSGRRCTKRSKACASSGARRSSSEPSPSTCSPCCSAARCPAAGHRRGPAGCRRHRARLAAGGRRHRRRRSWAWRWPCGRCGATSASSLLTVVALFGAFTIVLGVTRSFAVAFVALMVLSAADSVSVFIRATLVPLVTPTRAVAVCWPSRTCSSARRTSWARSSRAWPASSSAWRRRGARRGRHARPLPCCGRCCSRLCAGSTASRTRPRPAECVSAAAVREGPVAAG